MTDNKAALDAWNYISLFCGVNVKNEQDREALDKRFKILHSALTTPPAPTVMGDDVRGAVKIISDWENTLKQRPHLNSAVQTLIRAATPPQATDAQRQAALDAVENLFSLIVYAPVNVNDTQREVYARELSDKIKAALQSPAVPREVEKLRELVYSAHIHIGNFIGRTELNDVFGGAVPLNTHAKAIDAWLSEALALIGGKEG